MNLSWLLLLHYWKSTAGSRSLKNFHPVSNLTYLSIERVVMVRFNKHLIQNGPHEVPQSAYKQSHSTETALLKVLNDLFMAIDTYGGADLILLDLSAAFDTIDHTILLQRPHELGIRDAALDWLRSVVINGIRSSYRNLSFGVPQGSVLGPKLFTLYTTPLGAIARKYQLNFHLYADDIQLYEGFTPNNAESLSVIISNIQNCVTDIKSWMTSNMLQLNMDKTEVLVLMTKSLRNPIAINKNQAWSNRFINCKERKKSWCYIWQSSKLRSFCWLHLQICLVSVIQHQQKPKVSNYRCCQDPYSSLRDVQKRLLRQPVVRHPR